MASAVLSLVWIVLALGVGGILMYVLTINTKANKLIVRDPTNEKQYIQEYKVIEKKDSKTGVLYWEGVIWGPKIKTEKPPSASIDVGIKGKKYAEAYRISEDEFVWIRDRGIKIEKLDNGQIEIYEVEKDGKKKVLDSFQGFSTTQRQILINQYTKADEISKKKWSTGEIMGMVSVGALVLVIMVGFIFGGDILQGYNEIQANQLAAQNINLEIEKTQAAREAILAQAMGVDLEDLNIQISQNVRSTSGNVIVRSDETPPTN